LYHFLDGFDISFSACVNVKFTCFTERQATVYDQCFSLVSKAMKNDDVTSVASKTKVPSIDPDARFIFD